jgi:dCMP deaminase
VVIDYQQWKPEDKLRAAYVAAMNSTDRTTHVGAVLVDGGWNVVTGCNQHTKGFGHLDEHHQRPLKYELTEHAEREVILRAAREGIQTRGLVMVAPWATCPPCARAIVKSGISKVICHKECMDRTPERWIEMVALGQEILKRGGVEIEVWSGRVGDCENLFNDGGWLP